MTNTKSLKKGFTLIELIVVIAIIAILAAVSIVGYTKYIEESKKSAASQEIAQIEKAMMLDSFQPASDADVTFMNNTFTFLKTGDNESALTLSTSATHEDVGNKLSEILVAFFDEYLNNNESEFDGWGAVSFEFALTYNNGGIPQVSNATVKISWTRGVGGTLVEKTYDIEVLAEITETA